MSRGSQPGLPRFHSLPPWRTPMNRHDVFFLIFLGIAAGAILIAAPMLVSAAIQHGFNALIQADFQ